MTGGQSLSSSHPDSGPLMSMIGHSYRGLTLAQADPVHAGNGMQLRTQNAT
jgi:hypothetical protein